jgi:integrase/recombinase XerD
MPSKVVEESSKLSGKTYLSLHSHYHGKRSKKSLGLSFKTNPSTINERNERKLMRELAEQIRLKSEQEFLLGSYGLEEQSDYTKDFFQYADQYITRREGLIETRKFRAVMNKLKAFHKGSSLPCYHITESFLRFFVQSLERELNGESASNYFKKLKQIIKSAIDDRHFKTDPSSRIVVRKAVYIERQVLSVEELHQLWDADINNDHVKRAFLLCCMTGLRFCDVKVLCWKHVQGNVIALIQSKTKIAVRIPLNADARKLLGVRGHDDGLIFALPSHTACLKWLRIWTEKAGIKKHITFHCGRHSFGTNLILHEVDVATASKLLGHTSLTHTLRYVKISEQHKASAVAKLPVIGR